jgi:DNA-binding beta-propeller fold protein YncE
MCDNLDNTLVHLNADGSDGSPAGIPGFFDPIAVAVDPNDGGVWVGEGQGEFVRRYDAAGAFVGAALGFPTWRIAVDSTNGEAWAVSPDRHAVLRYSRTAVALDTLSGFQTPAGVAVDWRRHRIWVADFGAGRLYALRQDGSTAFSVGSLPQVRDVAVDLATGEAWATVPGLGAVARVAADGRVLGFVGGMAQPYVIGLDPGGHALPLAPAGLRTRSRD